MGGAKKYLSNQFRVRMLYFEGDEASEFYLSSLQNNRSALPLLCIRAIVFLACLGIVIWSAVVTGMAINFKYWPIYLTHWGLIFNTICSLFACWVSFVAYFQESTIDCSFGLPWYVKAYWFSYNVAVPVAFFITIFYWTILAFGEEEFAIDPVLDVFIHGVNAVLMLVLVLTAQHPSFFLHFYHPLCVALVYLVFTVIYYFSGGTNPTGDPWIYPDMDWREPGPATVVVLASTLLLLVIHSLVVLISLARDWCSRRFIRDTINMSLHP